LDHFEVIQRNEIEAMKGLSKMITSSIARRGSDFGTYA
jgi:hypothetical protein